MDAIKTSRRGGEVGVENDALIFSYMTLPLDG